jgi:sugar phosphate isomerase/epimerase
MLASEKDLLHRRAFLQLGITGLGASMVSPLHVEAQAPPFTFKYILSSAMYGTFAVADILPEVKKVGATHIDLWPAPHGNQREQVKEMGDRRFKELLVTHQVKLGLSSCYKLGPFGLQEEMRWAQNITGEGITLVCGGRGKKDLEGTALKAEVKSFVEKMKPHVAVAEETDCIITIENHKSNLIYSPDSLKYFADFTRDMPHSGISFAPHHLPQDSTMQAKLIRDLGPAIKYFYAQQYGTGAHHEQPREKEMLQMPGRGDLDFGPLVQALKHITFSGFTEIFMHPFPRGLPIRDTIPEITAEINRSRSYLNHLI